MNPNPNCTLCSLNETCVSVCIPPRGEGQVLIVGSTPDGEDDQLNVTFGGRSGQELERMLADAGFSVADYTVTYAVKCKPPQKRQPGPVEIHACSNYLKAEIHRVRPTAIVAMGDTALRALCRKGNLKLHRGRGVPLHASWDYTGCEVWPTYSPRNISNAPQLRNVVVTDLRRVRDIGRTHEDIHWSWWDGSAVRSNIVAWDIETDYDYKTKKGGDTITQLAVAHGLISTVSTDSAGLFRATQASVFVTHNGWAFDVPRLRSLGVSVPQGDDTLVLAYLDDESQPLNLEALCVKYLGVRGWKEDRDAAPGSDMFALYNARDAVYTRRLYYSLVDRLGPRKKIADVILAPAWDALLACSARGIAIDARAVARAREHYEHRASNLASEICGLSSGRTTNPKSVNQIAAALQADGHGNLSSTDAGTLAKLDQTPLVTAIREYRIVSKAMDAFVRPYEEVVRAGGRVHPEYTLWKTATGRTSARNLNVQQLSRDPILRSFFNADPGMVLSTVDYAAIEFRLAAHIAGEEGILGRYRENPEWDAHTFFASRFYGVAESEVTREQRQIAKSANFGLLYMAQWFTLQEYASKTAGLELTEEECRAIRATWHRTFPGFAGWYKSTRDQLLREGYVESLTGRRRHFGDANLMSASRFAASLREGVNFQVQSLAADVALLALAECHRTGLPINGFFHDAISFEHDGTLDMELVEECMGSYPVRTLKDAFGIELNVPLVVEAKHVSNQLVLA